MIMSREGCTRDSSECRISTTRAIKQPMIEWSPVYDGNGTMTNADPNTLVVTFTCATCMTTWSTETTAGVTLPASPPTEGEQP
jgi:hypothetical protein